jgi:hypothetical protein
MKAKISVLIAVILLSIFASNAFAVLRPTYPTKPYPPDHIIIIGEEGNDYADLRSDTRAL